MDGQPFKSEMRTAWAKELELDCKFNHTIPAWKHAGIPGQNWLRGADRVGNRMDLSLEIQSGIRRVSGVGTVYRKNFSKVEPCHSQSLSHLSGRKEHVSTEKNMFY